MPTEAEKRQQQKDAREIRVFLSSTFKDMDEERNYLLKKVFPEIRKMCAKRQVAFTEIDLRWGVTEEAAKSGATVEICLREIERCRDFPPFFIGFLGERYGWIPTNDDLKEYWERQAKSNDEETAKLAEKIKKAVEQEISVTELEMQLAVLAADASLDTEVHGNHALFLLRDQSLTKKFFKKNRSEKSKTAKTDFYDAADGKLDDLKKRIRESGFLGLDNYKTVEAFGEQIKQHLLKAIDEIFPEDEQVDEWEKLDRAHRVFANHRRENFLPRVDVREQILEAIRERVEKPYLGPVVLTGPSGQGKSALMADLAKHLNENEPELELVLEHYVGAEGETSIEALLNRLLYRLHQLLGDQMKTDVFNKITLKPSGDNRFDEENKKNIVKRLTQLTSLVKERKKEKNKKFSLVCVVDALDQLNNDSLKELPWLLRETSAAELLIITSVADGTEARGRVEEHMEGQIQVPPLDTDARRKMVTQTFERFRKKLESDQVERLASAKQCGSPLFLKLALEDLRLNARHESMTEKVSTILEAPDASSLFLTNFLLDEDYNRTEQPKLAVKFMAFIGTAYDGLSENELADLLAFENKSRLPQKYLSQLINNFSPFLITRNGRIAPMHRMFGEAALAKYDEIEIRYELSKYFFDLLGTSQNQQEKDIRAIQVYLPCFRVLKSKSYPYTDYNQMLKSKTKLLSIVKKFRYPGYTNIFEMLPDAKRIWGTETLYGDWDGRILLLAKDAAPASVIEKLIKKEGTGAWRHAQRELGDGGWRTNERLVKLCEPIEVGKLYGTVAGPMLLKQEGWSRALPGLKMVDEFRSYLIFTLFWVLSEMKNVEVIACLGSEAWHVAAETIGRGETKNEYAKYRDEGRYLEGSIGHKKIILTAHYHPAARRSEKEHLKSWEPLYKMFG